MRVYKHALQACFLLMIASGISPAQNVTGTITGVVTDSSGAGVAAAQVTITNGATAISKQMKTNSGGNYTASLLPVGKYDLTVEAKGFKKTNNQGIIVNVNDQLTINVSMQVGDVTQEVTVEAQAVQVQLQQGAEQSTTISGTQIRELALVTRNYEQLIGLMPGVTSGSVDQLYVGVTLPSGSTATIPFSINGTRNSQSAYLVDGGDNVDRGSNQTLLNTPSIDAIAEFKVLRTGFSAEFGRAAGGVVSVVTKSGTNEFHGDAFEFVRNNAFAANNFFNNASSLNVVNGKAQVAPLHYNNFGETLGGPVWIPKVYNGKNRTFFFFSEEFRRVITYAGGTATVPTTAELGGVFPHAVCIRYTGSTCAQTSTNISTVDPASQQYIKDIYSRVALPTGTNTLNSLFRNVYNFEQELYRLDHSFGDRLRLSARFMRDQIPTVEPQGLFTGGLPIPGVATTNTNAPGRNWSVRGASSFSSTLLNEIGWDFSYGAIVSNPTGFINSTYSPDIKATLPFAVTLTQVPTLAFSGGTSIGGFGPYRDFNRNHNIFDNVTKILGPHSMRFGVSYNHYQKTENAAGGNQGTFTFTPASTPTGTTTFEQSFANFLLGNVATFTQSSKDVTPDIREQQLEFYAQDDWRIKPNLTLNFGVRYSLFGQPIDKNGQLTNFDPSLYNATNAPAFTATGLLAAPVPNPYINGIAINGQTSGHGQAISGRSNTDIGPRIGFAWDPYGDGKTSVRGGYGIFFDSTLYGIYEQNIFANPPFVVSATINGTTLDNPAGGTATVSNSPKVLRGVSAQYKTPYTQSWSFEVQRQITPSAQLNVAYVGNKSTHLLGIVDLNSVYPGLVYTSGLVSNATVFTSSASETILNKLRPYAGYNAINSIEPWFNANYHSLQIYAKKQLTGDSLMTGSYTWSKNLTDNQTDRSSAPQNRYNFNSGEYGRATFDRTHVFNVSIVYTLPFFKEQKGLAGKLLGGWEASGIGSYYTGLPYTVTTANVDPAGLGILGSSAASPRPDVGITTTCPTGNPNNFASTRLAWFNTNCFTQVPSGVHRPGDAGRGIIHGPGYEGWNISASKNIVFKERFRLQIRGEAANAFNHTNPSTFGSLSTISSLFGQITGYRDPRIIQLAGKFYF